MQFAEAEANRTGGLSCRESVSCLHMQFKILLLRTILNSNEAYMPRNNLFCCCFLISGRTVGPTLLSQFEGYVRK
jgi:hypothetical protein